MNWTTSVVIRISIVVIIWAIAWGYWRQKVRRARERGLWPLLGQIATDEHVRRLAKAGEKILAIKLWRQIHGIGFVEARDAVERLTGRPAIGSRHSMSQPAGPVTQTVMSRTYERHWHEYRKRRNAAVIVIATLVPGVALVTQIPERICDPRAATAFLILAWFAAIEVTLMWVMIWRCPRCGETFHARREMFIHVCGNPFARHCRNCGLPKWACASEETGVQQPASADRPAEP